MLQSVFNFKYQEEYKEEDFVVSESNQEAFDIIVNWPQNWGVLPYPTILAITGAKGCGKTHLVNLWRKNSKASEEVLAAIKLREPSLRGGVGDKAISEPRSDIFLCSSTTPEIAASVGLQPNPPRKDASLNLMTAGPNHNIIVEDIDSGIIFEPCLFHIFNSCHENGKFLLLTSAVPLSHIGFKLPDLDSRIKSIREVKISEPDDFMVQMILFKHFSKRSIKVEENVMNYLMKILPRNFSEIAEKINILDTASLVYKKDITIPFIKRILNL
jgi:chromosomal replication initiation ATPase DnaA